MPHATTEPVLTEDKALSGLVSADSRQLLDLINDLRNLGINKWVELPKIVVVGDQNSGKSSVLEAISKLNFPSGDGLCTTFATRLTLKREPKRAPTIRIEPSRSHDLVTQDKLRSYKCSDADAGNFETVVLKAKKHIVDTVGKQQDSFLEDELIIETCSPEFPPVTLVDLPGIIQTANENQQDEDVQTVKKLVTTYMKEEKSIILAVVSASSGVANQAILGLAKELDPQGKRTLGIITKPDILKDQSDEQARYLRTAANEIPKYRLDLGWHVVRNLDSESRDAGLDRDQEETVWFNNHPLWESSIGVQNVGIEPLRARLATLLEDHTRKSLPEVVKAIQQRLEKCRADLAKLGDARETAGEQRQYLTSISEDFKRLIELANEGIYRDAFFSPTTDTSRRIRASVQNLNKQFAHVLRSYGHNLQLQGSPSFIYLGAPEHFKNLLKAPEVFGQEKCLTEVKKLSAVSMGKELDGMPNVEVIRELFQLKSKRWRQLAETHLTTAWNLVHSVLHSMIHHVADGTTAQRIIRTVIDKSLEGKKLNMVSKLHELLAPHIRCHPITYNPALQALLHDGQDKAGEKGTPELETLRHVEAYYRIALDTFIDNVTILIVEMCLIDGLSNIFTPSVVASMNELELDQLASESAMIKNQRRSLKSQESTLEQAYRKCSINSIEPVQTSIELIYHSPVTSGLGVSNSTEDARSLFPSLSAELTTRPKTSSASSSTMAALDSVNSFALAKPENPFGGPSSSSLSNFNSSGPQNSLFGARNSLFRANNSLFGANNSLPGGASQTSTSSAATTPSKSSGKIYPLAPYYDEIDQSLGGGQPAIFQAINTAEVFQDLSFEELRLAETAVLKGQDENARWLASLGPFGKMLDPGHVLDAAKEQAA